MRLTLEKEENEHEGDIAVDVEERKSVPPGT